MKGVIFNIGPKIMKFRNDEDKLFFDDQTKDRKFTIGQLDVQDTRLIRENEARRQRDGVQKSLKAPQPQPDLILPDRLRTNICRNPPLDCDPANEESDEDPDWEESVSQATKYRRVQSQDIHVTLNKKRWLENVAVSTLYLHK